ncbi:MAG: peptidyl-prolyl cis-trans isomerase [Flavobacteriaceae bacterium]|nr:peptidyl-prolyl cis-trans isomerase [Flavobacteriaceae bacterium]
MKSKSLLIVLGLGLLMLGCTLSQGKPSKAIARVQNEYLFLEDIQGSISSFQNVNDSLLVVNNLIKNWATKQLLLSNAYVNLREAEIKRLNILVQSYKTDLYTKTYKEKLVKTKIDTLISQEEILEYYELNKRNFKLNEPLLKGRYIRIFKENYNMREIVKRFRRFSEKDIVFIDSIALQFSSFLLNDSIWVQSQKFLNKISPLSKNDYNNFLKKSKFQRLEDSLEVYLVHINEKLERGDTAPLEYVKPTIKQILTNKRKVEFSRNFNNEILQDALRKNEFEIYNLNE